MRHKIASACCALMVLALMVVSPVEITLAGSVAPGQTSGRSIVLMMLLVSLVVTLGFRRRRCRLSA